MRLPNFLVIGAPRSGTTTLHYSLGQHPEVFVSPNKEPHFFLFDERGAPPPSMPARQVQRLQQRSIRDLNEYTALFDGATERHRAVGESSPGYMLFPEVAARIKAHLPDVRLLAILRQPIDQALSFFIVRGGGDVPDNALPDRFAEALTRGWPTGAPSNGYGMGISEYGLYARHLAPFFEQFDCGQIKVVLLEELEQDGERIFAELFRFLGVDDSFRPDLSHRYNISGTPKNALVHRALSGNQRAKRLLRAILPNRATERLARLQHRWRSANLRRKQILPADLRRELTLRFYARDIEALESLLGRDLSLWRQ